jgi:3-phosphoshikimate 1-carboxyvinyltransferase
MRLRIIKPLVETLRQMGLSIRYLKNEGSCPLEISGNLTGGIASVSGLTSQYLSALLISLPCALNDSEISVQDLMERSYVDLTIEWLKNQGISFTHQQNDNVDIYKIKGGQRYKEFNASISGDFSSASYLIAAAVLTQSNIELEGLDMQDQQGDKILVTILQEMGADIVVVEPSRLIIRGGKTLKGLKIDATDIPDLLPTLAVIGTYAEGKTEIYNAHHARIKETDRIHSMKEGLERLGARTEEHHDNLTIYQSKLKGAHVKGYGDHRTVMALALAGMLAQGETIIDEGESISKTFPTFVEVMQSLGAKMQLVN